MGRFVTIDITYKYVPIHFASKYPTQWTMRGRRHYMWSYPYGQYRHTGPSYTHNYNGQGRIGNIAVFIATHEMCAQHLLCRRRHVHLARERARGNPLLVVHNYDDMGPAAHPEPTSPPHEQRKPKHTKVEHFVARELPRSGEGSALSLRVAPILLHQDEVYALRGEMRRGV
eukprot:4762233-Prymnesium_polylepis.2